MFKKPPRQHCTLAQLVKELVKVELSLLWSLVCNKKFFAKSMTIVVAGCLELLSKLICWGQPSLHVYKCSRVVGNSLTPKLLSGKAVPIACCQETTERPITWLSLASPRFNNCYNWVVLLLKATQSSLLIKEAILTSRKWYSHLSNGSLVVLPSWFMNLITSG